MTENELLLKDYRPKSTLKAKRTPIEKAKYPVIDVHNHLENINDVHVLVKVMDEVGIKAIVNLSGGWGEELKRNIDKFDGSYPGRFVTFCNLDFTLVDTAEFKEHVRTTIKEGVKSGIRGIKIYKELGLRYKDAKGNLILPDDDRLKVIWDTAAEENLPVLYHIADPEAFFQPLSSENERIEILLNRPNWHFYGPEFPTRDKLFECQRKLLENNPHTTFILPHVASNPEDLEYVSKLMDSYSNFVVDMSARVGDLGRQPYSARKFFIKYADRILFGLDGTPTAELYKISFRFLETDDEYFSYRLETGKMIARWMIYGIFLPDDVLKKVYYENAIRILGQI